MDDVRGRIDVKEIEFQLLVFRDVMEGLIKIIIEFTVDLVVQL